MKVKYEAMIKLEIIEESKNEADVLRPHPQRYIDKTVQEALKDEFSGQVNVDIFSKIYINR